MGISSVFWGIICIRQLIYIDNPLPNLIDI